MKAVRIHSTGGPEVLRIEEVPNPVPGTGEVLVNLQAAAINHLDIWVRTGNMPVELPRILGSEGAGTVEKLGPGVTGVEEGARVVVTPWIYPPRAYHTPNLLAQLIGVAHDGCYAEYVAIPAANVWPLPKGLNFIEAASIFLTFTTAYHMIVTRAQLRPGEDVLVVGATGGVGTAAVQIAHALGARVIAATRDPQKGERLRGLGADVIVDSSHNFSQEVKRLTNGSGADLVVELVGHTTWRESNAAVRKGSRIATCGATSGAEITVNLQDLYRREIAYIGSYGGTPDEIQRVFKLVEEKRVHPVLDKTYPLSKAREAQERMEKSLHFGKIVLTM
ncbi:Putative Alcohol dehydrogenase zinc-binding domain protein [Candidatus Bipolaricaulis anaerobius]|uniref:Alcohol dehydrogenase zinc-binding domain protein n=1 Tax=Candidatus Bipolaricaulis anaerobius TaxID=2026885 RepID=A0A2X3KV30_9BACT|nr:zinc-binding dehydrogenase [Candidatus Bipolaricaulis anaerobius]SQD92488.1 Putative Alcohol dehydrogenase zinc-binding domain protein [Candidatus Bipolaricaulis anaerobius]